MDFTKIKSVRDYIREQEEEEIQNAANELDAKVEALFLTGEPVTDESLQIFADENEIPIEELKAKVYGLVTTLLTTKEEESEEGAEEAPVDESLVTEEEEEVVPEEEDTEAEETVEEPSTESGEASEDEDEDAAAEFDIGDNVSFEVENEEHPLASMSLEVVDKDGEFVQCLAKNPETGAQATYWFKVDELKKIPNELEVNPSGDDVEDVEEVPSYEDSYEEVKKESLSDILRKNLNLLRG